jgi:hypothetical protein
VLPSIDGRLLKAISSEPELLDFVISDCQSKRAVSSGDSVFRTASSNDLEQHLGVAVVAIVALVELIPQYLSAVWFNIVDRCPKTIRRGQRLFTTERQGNDGETTVTRGVPR